jgi:hypothetical protein
MRDPPNTRPHIGQATDLSTSYQTTPSLSIILATTSLPPPFPPTDDCLARVAYHFRLCTLYSAFVTLMKRSSSLMGIQLVRVFIAFSKSDSSIISLMPSINAADVACKMSSVVPKFIESAFSDGVRIWSLSPSSMKTSHTRSWAGKGME